MKSTLIISLVVALVFFTLGYSIGANLSPKTGGKAGSLLSGLATGDNTFQAGWEAAKKRFADSGFYPSMINLEVKNLVGQVVAVKDNTVTLKIMPLEPLADPDLDERIVKVDANTKIYALVQKDQAEYQKEMENFNKKMQEQMKDPLKPDQAPTYSAEAIIPPEFFIKKEASLSDIKIGVRIDVMAADKDIKNAKQFSAAEITIQTVLAMTPATTAPTGGQTAQ